MMIWVFASFILLNYFVSDISSVLVVEKVETINSLQELKLRTDTTILVVEDSSYHRTLKEVNDFYFNTSFILNIFN